MEEIFLLIACKLWMCVIHSVCLISVSISNSDRLRHSLGLLSVCHHASAESVLAELLRGVSDRQETSARQLVSCVHPKIYLFSSLLPNETAIDFLNVHKNLKTHLKYKEVAEAGMGDSCPIPGLFS